MSIAPRIESRCETVGFNTALFYFEFPFRKFNFARFARKTVKKRTTRKVVLSGILQSYALQNRKNAHYPKSGFDWIVIKLKRFFDLVRENAVRTLIAVCEDI